MDFVREFLNVRSHPLEPEISICLVYLFILFHVYFFRYVSPPVSVSRLHVFSTKVCDNESTESEDNETELENPEYCETENTEKCEIDQSKIEQICAKVTQFLRSVRQRM